MWGVGCKPWSCQPWYAARLTAVQAAAVWFEAVCAALSFMSLGIWVCDCGTACTPSQVWPSFYCTRFIPPMVWSFHACADGPQPLLVFIVSCDAAPMQQDSLWAVLTIPLPSPEGILLQLLHTGKNVSSGAWHTSTLCVDEACQGSNPCCAQP